MLNQPPTHGVIARALYGYMKCSPQLVDQTAQKAAEEVKADLASAGYVITRPIRRDRGCGASVNLKQVERCVLPAGHQPLFGNLRHITAGHELFNTNEEAAADREGVGAGGHDLVVSFGDCEFHGECSCGKPLGTIRPDQSLDELGRSWERHVMTEVPR
jgi:hypothetical protein